MIIIVIVFGLALGSFVNALVWRLHEQELRSEKIIKSKKASEHAVHEKSSSDPLSIVHGRSMCPDCHHQLQAIDLIPVLSWVSLGGKCRYCHKSISWQYPFVELLTMVLFILSDIFWPLGFHGAGLLSFIVWLVCLVGFMALAVYDLRWYLLPNRIVYPLIVLVCLQILAIIYFFGGGSHEFLGAVYGALIGGGLFYGIFQISKGAWIGGGDVKLGTLLGLIVGGPVNSFLLLFIGSLAGSFISIPLMLSGVLKRNAIVPFGPFLLLAAIIIRLFGTHLVHTLRAHGILP